MPAMAIASRCWLSAEASADRGRKLAARDTGPLVGTWNSGIEPRSIRPTLGRDDDLVDKSPGAGGRDVNGDATEPHPHGALPSDPSRDAEGATGAGDESQADLGQLEARLRIGD